MKTYFFIVLILAVLSGGCITKGGKKLSGVVETGHGTYRLQSAIDREKRKAAEEKKAEEARRKALEKVKSKQTKLPTAKSKPIIPSPQPVEAEDVPIKIAPADSRTPFTPTVTKASLSPAEILIENLKNVGNEEGSTNAIVNGYAGGDNPKEESKVKIDWMKLIKFYLIATLFLVFVYFGFKAAKKKTNALANQKKTKRKATKRTIKKRK